MFFGGMVGVYFSVMIDQMYTPLSKICSSNGNSRILEDGGLNTCFMIKGYIRILIYCIFIVD